MPVPAISGRSHRAGQVWPRRAEHRPGDGCTARCGSGIGAAPASASPVRSRPCGTAQRGANRQPGGGSIMFGGRPTMAASGVWLGRSARGIDASSAEVYGCSTSAKSSSVGACSTNGSGVHHGHLVGVAGDDAEVVGDQDHRHPRSRRSRSSRSRIWRCTVTSSAVVGSSAISNRGQQAMAMAMATR